MTDSAENKEEVSINFSNSHITAGRDVSVIGTNKETLIEDVGDSATVIVGKGNTLTQPAGTADLAAQLTDWQAKLESKIDSLPDLLIDDKTDLKETVEKIKAEIEKIETANPGRLERLLNSLATMVPDIFEVAVTTLTTPLSGIGLVLKKISEKAIEIRQQSTAELPDD